MCTNENKYHFLMYTFCESEEEREEMLPWVKRKGIEEAYRIIIHLFYDDDNDCTM